MQNIHRTLKVHPVLGQQQVKLIAFNVSAKSSLHTIHEFMSKSSQANDAQCVPVETSPHSSYYNASFKKGSL